MVASAAKPRTEEPTISGSEKLLELALPSGTRVRFPTGTDLKYLRDLAGLYSLIATCEANDVNPVVYLADVLMRVQTHPASRIDELLPHRWRGPAPPPS